MEDQPALPELNQALLDAPTLAALFTDLQALTEIVQVRTKGGAEAYSDPGDLEAARQALLARAVLGIQITYRYQGGLWIDTLMGVPEGVQVTRIQVPPLS